MRILTLALISASILAATAANAQVAYSNGPIDGTFNAWTVDDGQYIANSFELNSTTTITGFTFGGWSKIGQTIDSIDFAITDSLGSLSFSTAILSPGAVIPNTGLGDWDVRNYTASLAPLSLAAGTYYLVLGNAQTSGNGFGYWDINNGPSTAFGGVGSFDSLKDVAGPGSGSSAFQILTSDAPEPASWAMMLSGFGLVGGTLRTRRRTAVSFG